MELLQGSNYACGKGRLNIKMCRVLNLRGISGAEARMSAPKFKEVYTQYLSEVGLTFPELDSSSTKALKKTSWNDFLASVTPILDKIAARDSKIFDKKGVQIAPGVIMTDKLWASAGKPTHKAMWDFLSSLVLLASYEKKHSPNEEKDADIEGLFDISGAEDNMKKMFDNLGKQFSSGSFSSFFDGMKEAAEGFKETFGKAMDLSGDMPKIPEKLFKGHIAKIAEELAKEFKPEDFGISPELMNSNDTTAVFEFLQEVFTKNPETLMKGAKKIAARIQEKLRKGEVRREELIREAEELMGEFQNNSMFKDMFSQLSSTLRGAGGGGGGDGGNSERRKAVQDRLRKKLEAKKAAASGTAPVKKE